MNVFNHWERKREQERLRQVILKAGGVDWGRFPKGATELKEWEQEKLQSKKSKEEVRSEQLGLGGFRRKSEQTSLEDQGNLHVRQRFGLENQRDWLLRKLFY